MEFALILKILFVGDFIDFVMSDFESVVEVSADGVGLDEVDEEEIEDLLSEY